eukprot:6316781-Lingulodinium_polyedra.AAC.1
MFGNAGQAIPSLIHAAKGVLRSELGCRGVTARGLQRFSVCKTEPTILRLAGVSLNLKQGLPACGEAGPPMPPRAPKRRPQTST